MTHYHAPQNKAAENFAYFPAFIHVTGKKIIVLGGGDVAAGKLRLLCRSQAKITVIADELCPDIAAMRDRRDIHWEPGPFIDTMLNGAVMVFDGSNDPRLTRRMRIAAKRRNIPVNVVDKTDQCDFIVPAILDRAPVMITISTGGCAPALARMLRQRLETAIPSSVSRLAAIARDARKMVADILPDNGARQRFWTRFFRTGLNDRNNQDRTTRPDPHLSIDQALQSFTRDAGPDQSGRVTHATLAARNPYDMPHGVARALETADIVFHDPGIAADILALARRDATCISLETGPDGLLPEQTRETMTLQADFFARQGSNIVCLYCPPQTQHLDNVIALRGISTPSRLAGMAN
ncbi:MAG: NAD(P)-dependent oxidoreductase [Pseudomonadota bacterium]